MPVRRLGLSLALALGLGWAGVALAGEKPDIVIEGSVALPAELAAAVSGTDRLVFKMYHPDQGIEKDLKYWILDDYAFPQAFRLAPTVTMAGMARWPSYVIEVFTDTDRDVLNLIAGELHATTGAPVALGTKGVTLTLGVPGS